MSAQTLLARVGIAIHRSIFDCDPASGIETALYEQAAGAALEVAGHAELLEAAQIAIALLGNPKDIEQNLLRSDTFQQLVDRIRAAIAKGGTP